MVSLEQRHFDMNSPIVFSAQAYLFVEMMFEMTTVQIEMMILVLTVLGFVVDFGNKTDFGFLKLPEIQVVKFAGSLCPAFELFPAP